MRRWFARLVVFPLTSRPAVLAALCPINPARAIAVVIDRHWSVVSSRRPHARNANSMSGKTTRRANHRRMVGGYRDGWEPVDSRDARIAALEAENARLRAALEDIAQTTGRVGLFPTDTLIEILDVARAALAAPTSGDADADH